jgi:RNA polymerase sigma-70 factor (ECF subfamily)
MGRHSRWHHSGDDERSSDGVLASSARKAPKRAAVAVPGGAAKELFREALLKAIPKLRRFALSYCDTPPDADDAVQLTCERALRRWQQWAGHGALEHWLVKILVNAWRDERRSRRLRAGPTLSSLPEPEDADSDAAERLYCEQVRGEMQRLPDGQRDVLWLVAAEGFSYQETAEALDIPIGTVMSRLCRARQALTTRLGGQRR